MFIPLIYAGKMYQCTLSHLYILEIGVAVIWFTVGFIIGNAYRWFNTIGDKLRDYRNKKPK